MLRCRRIALCCLAMCVWSCPFAGDSYAGTIIKLGLGTDVAPDIEFDGMTLKTNVDGDAATTGDQNTRVEYLGFLSGLIDIMTPTASFSLDGLDVSGPAVVFGGVLVIQNFSGGTLELYDPANSLLLSGTLNASTLSGPLGPPATGALFTTSFSMVTGGSLAPQIDPDSLTFSMSMTDINGGGGLSVAGVAPSLDPFSADVTLNISADPIPEPTSALLALVGGLLMVFASRLRMSVFYQG